MKQSAELNISCAQDNAVSIKSQVEKNKEKFEGWKSGQSMNSIATWLNRKGIKSPRNTPRV